jgi:hypothetical protein
VVSFRFRQLRPDRIFRGHDIGDWVGQKAAWTSSRREKSPALIEIEPRLLSCHYIDWAIPASSDSQKTGSLISFLNESFGDSSTFDRRFLGSCNRFLQSVMQIKFPSSVFSNSTHAQTFCNSMCIIPTQVQETVPRNTVSLSIPTTAILVTSSLSNPIFSYMPTWELLTNF